MRYEQTTYTDSARALNSTHDLLIMGAMLCGLVKINKCTFFYLQKDVHLFISAKVNLFFF